MRLEQEDGGWPPYDVFLLSFSPRVIVVCLHLAYDNLAETSPTMKMKKPPCFPDRENERLHHLETYATRKQAQKHLFEYIEYFYNRNRIHSSIGYVSPSQYERMYYNQLQKSA
jgi:transposase InsO family protein